MSLSPGTRLGPYEIVSPLGAGGMGEVYRARDTKLNRDVAIKVLLPAVANDPDRLARFSREAQVLASLNHPNIAHIYGIEDAAIVMELVDGDDLAQRIARGPIPLGEALPIARQIAEALEAAHEHGIIHRDLKPANIKVREDGTVKVLDFGLAKAMEPASGLSSNVSMSPTITTPAMTQAGVIMGTAAYMAPEQARGKFVDKRADIWAFGCVIYEMLTGVRAFEGEDVTVVMASIIKSEPDWKALPTSTPESMRVVLKRCLQKDPKTRLRDMGDVRLALEGAFDMPVVVRTSRTGRARLAWSMAALALLAIIISWISFKYLRPSEPAEAMVRYTVAPPFHSTRSAHQPFAISPDGQTIAFRAISEGRVGRIFTRRLDQADAQPVAGTENASGAFWSPDSRSLGFFKEGGLYRTDLDGRLPRRLCDVGRAGLHGTWSARGVIVFTSNTGLLRVADTGGSPAPVTSLDAASKEVTHASPFFLPDGRHVLFLALAAGQVSGPIWAVSIDEFARTRVAESSGGAAYSDGWLLTTNGSPRRLVAQPFDAERLSLSGVPLSVSDQLVGATTRGDFGFSVSSSGALVVDRPKLKTHQLTWMDRLGRVVETIGPAAAISDFDLAHDVERVVALVTDVASLRSDLWLFDKQQPGSRLTFQGAGGPMWGHDGRRVFFTTNFELWSLRLGAAAPPERFENAVAFGQFQDITRDGRYVVVRSLGLPFSIWIQSIADASERRVLIQSQFSATQARVSPDGRWVAFTQTHPGGAEILIQPFDRPGDRIQVSRAGGIGPIWREDGRELYYESVEGLMAVALTARGSALDAGTPQKLFSMRTQGNVVNQPHNVEVAANGQKFLVNTIVGDSDNAPLEVTLNWTAGLKK